ncbi:MAG: ATP-grasp domain-containing protein [Candidatus Thiodiazotropha sp. (ex Lucina pensylvanica)]|nr:ATP-grasp domain-containing protein [Candidatus Thiodiazotropha sp. (ex Lucina pensylvanica)]MBT3051062.1 ATP-grasp domain-containing protein [Candidatus Thiodiazotropha sp. (ex Codakia orbicularis)]
MDSKKRLLIAGGGYADIPLIVAAKQLGYYVITTGNRPDDLGHQFSDKYYNADFSSPVAMLKLAVTENIEAICPCANDFSAISSAYVAQKLGLPGHDSYDVCKLIHHKDKYRDFAAANGISTPKALSFSSIGDAEYALTELRYPIIIKPVDLTGGKGISTINSPSDTQESLVKAFSMSREKRVVAEEYITGSRHGFSALIQTGKVKFHFADNEYYYLNPYMVSGASAPASITDNVIRDMKIQIEKIVKLLHLVDGIFHIQYILTDKGPVIIEICRRPPGDLYVSLVKYATDLDYPRILVQLFTGEKIHGINQKEIKGYFLRHCIMANRNGVLRDIQFSAEIRDNIIDKEMFWEQGLKVNDYLTQKFGIVFMKFNSMDEMLDMSKKMQCYIKPIIDD